MAAPSFIALRSEYTRLWAAMEIKAAVLSEVERTAHTLVSYKPRYVAVSKVTTVPWQVIAVIHELEAGADFRGVLHNGEKIIGTGKKTTLVPKGRGPFATWEAAAEDALALDHLTNVSDWSIEHACYMLELFNGFGYREHAVHSPYLWSGSNNYVRGKFTSDGHFDVGVSSKQIGCMPILKEMMKFDPSISFAPSELAAAPKPLPATHSSTSVPTVKQPEESVWRKMLDYVEGK